MTGTFNLLQLLQAPSTKLFLKSSNLPKDPFVVMDTRVSSTLSFRRQIQASAYEVVNKSYIFSTGGGAEITTGDKPLGKIETVGAFQKLPMVMPSTDILYSALRKMRRISPTKGISNIAKRVRNQGAKQLDTLMKELAVPLRGYKENFPNKNYLHPYERSLIELTLGEGSYEEVLKWGACLEKGASNYVYSQVHFHAFQKCDKRISQIYSVVLGKVDALRKRIVSLGKEHASLCAKSLSKREAEERLNEGLKKLEAMFQLQGTCVDDLLNIAKTLRAMPVVDPETPTLCLVGAPNVGKSSLVRILSSGKPEICNYPFTTRGILMGHIAINYKRFQVTDTPGLLKRCDDDRNNLEKLTLAVLSHLPTAVLYVHDLSGECGTSPSDQLIIYKEIRERFKDHLWLDVVSKCDLLQSSPTILVEDEDVEVKRYKKKGPEGAIHVSVKSEIGIIELKARVHNLLVSQMARLSSENNEES